MTRCAILGNLRAHRFRALPLLAVGALLLQFGTGSSATAAGGALDRTFGARGKVIMPAARSVGNAVALQVNGKIVVAGGAVTGGSPRLHFAVARFDRDGTLDATFGMNGIVHTSFYQPAVEVALSVIVQRDGRIVAIGEGGPGGKNIAMARYLRDGRLDPTFGVSGKVVTAFGAAYDNAFPVFAAAIGPYGKIVVGGQSATLFAVARFDTNGKLDRTFSGDGKAAIGFGPYDQWLYDVAVQPDGKIVAAGFADYSPVLEQGYSALARLNVNGTLDHTFGGDGKVTTSFQSPRCGGDSEAYALAIQPDRKIVEAGIAGCADTPGGASGAKPALARYLPNGTLDQSFGLHGRFAGTSQDYYVPSDVALEPSGKIVVVGSDGSRFLVHRYLANGSLDQGFGSHGRVATFFLGVKPQPYLERVAIQQDGKIVALGSWRRAVMARYLPR